MRKIVKIVINFYYKRSKEKKRKEGDETERE